MSRAARRCRTCRHDFEPRRFHRMARQCEPCRTGFMAPLPSVEKRGGITTHHLGILGDHALLSCRATVERDVRIDPAKLSDGEFYAIRHRHQAAPGEHFEDVMAAERLRIHARLAPSRAAPFVALED